MLAWPAYANRNTNPYNANLYSSLERAGGVVSEFSHRAMVGCDYDVLHIHWPDAKISNRSRSKALLRSASFLVLLLWVRLRRRSIVWTVHNLRQHEGLHPALERAYMAGFTRLLSGWIALTEGGAREALKVHRHLRRVPREVVPIGHFKTQVERTRSREDARDEAGIDSAGSLVGTFGRLRPYKNVEELVEAFESCPPEWRLLVACDPVDPEYAAALRASSDDLRVTMLLKDFSDRELEVLVQAMDLVVLPYRSILNSASLLYALSCGRPALVPGVASLKEVAGHVAGEAVQFYEPPLTASAIERALEATRGVGGVDLSAFDWDRIGAATYDFLSAISRR